MACFIVPAAEAAVISLAVQVAKAKECRLTGSTKSGGQTAKAVASKENIPFSRKLRWLSQLLWGGSFLLGFEHVWHGEVVAWFPFLTAAPSPQEMAEMLHEMATAGTGMAAVVTAAWVAMLLVADAAIKKPAPSQAESLRRET